MSKIVFEFDDTPEVRKALQYLANFAGQDEEEFWRNDGPDGKPNPVMADAYAHIADVIDLKLLPIVT